MIDRTIRKWAGHNFYANLPEAQFYAFRETGYAGALLKMLDKNYAELFQEYDVLLYFQLVHDPPVWKLQGFKKPLILFIAGHEAPGLPEEVIQSAAFIFKQYLDPRVSVRHPHVFRIPVGPSSVFPERAVLPFDERMGNVFFAGNLHRGRKRLYQQLSGLKWLPFPLLYRVRQYLKKDFSDRLPASTITFSGQFHTGFSPGDYASRLADAKMVLCPYGVDAQETMRHFEAAKQGCIVVTDRMPDVWYYRDAPFVTIKGWKHVITTLTALLNDQDGLQQKHAETLEWWQNVCAPEAVCRYIISKIRDGEAANPRIRAHH